MSFPSDMLEGPPFRALAGALVHFVWQGALAAALLYGLLRGGLLRSAGARHAAACVALLVSLGMVVATAWILWRIDLAPAATKAVAVSAPPSVSAGEPGATPPSAAGGVPAGWREVSGPWVLFVWLIGVTLLSLRLLGCWAFTQHIRTRCLRPVSDVIALQVRTLCARMGIARFVRVVQSAAVEVPVVIGWLRPVILLPASALAGLSPDQLQSILLHELAHIRRCDYLVNLLQSVAETLLFYHPAIWWISARIRDEREHCCDDLVLASGVDRVVYAEALAGLETQRRQASAFVLAATDGALLVRIQRILSGSGPVISISRPAAAMAGALIIALVATVIVQARMLGGREETPGLGNSAPPDGPYFSDLPAPLLARLRGNWVDVPVETVLREIGKAASQDLKAPEYVATSRISAKFDNARVCDAISAVTERQRFAWRCDDSGRIEFYPWPARAEHLAWRARSQAADPLSKKWFDAGFTSITYRTDAAPLRDVAREFGNQMGARVRVPADLASRPVTCDFHLIGARQALDELLSPLGLDYRVLGPNEIEILPK
ncbi:MAG: M56 family metallopeptidase [Verrucomicrobiae bacterium]|nr:M56 family metallopeptidase [Verrucomicrobiae bacterium]